MIVPCGRVDQSRRTNQQRVYLFFAPEGKFVLLSSSLVFNVWDDSLGNSESGEYKVTKTTIRNQVLFKILDTAVDLIKINPANDWWMYAVFEV